MAAATYIACDSTAFRNPRLTTTETANIPCFVLASGCSSRYYGDLPRKTWSKSERMVKSSSGGQGSGTFSSGSPGDRNSGGNSRGNSSEALLRDLVVRLQDHSDSLRRDIRRLQRALVEINGAIALSLDRVERLRANTERLHAIFGNASDNGGPGEESRPREDRRSGAERRSGGDRRRARSEVTGLLRWIEGTSLDRRRAPDRRVAEDRRRIDESSERRDRLVVPMTSRRWTRADVISLADYRRARHAAPGKARP